MVNIDKATRRDCRAIAELALMAGEGIPAWFWEQSRTEEEDLVSVGARNAASETENFSYRNVWLAVIGGRIAGMLLAYPLPDSVQAWNPEDYPAFLLPLIELEQCAPGSFYINMLAAYPRFRNQGVGCGLMAAANTYAREAGCRTLSVEVFEQNQGAVRLYQRLGYRVHEQRDVIPHPSHPYTGKLLLLVKDVAADAG